AFVLRIGREIKNICSLEKGGKMIHLGDQSPWLGGLLRAKVLVEAGEEVKYFTVDTDFPFVVTGNPLAVIKGWPAYSSIAVRCPWTPCAPEVKAETSSMISSWANSPPGMSYLGGPRKEVKSILELDKDPSLIKLLKEMIQVEISWASKISSSSKIFTLDFERISELTSKLHLMLRGAGQINSFSGFFQDSTPKLWKYFPSEYFWEIGPWGRAEVGASNRTGIIIPKGKIIPLEIAARGYELGCTNLPYLDEVVKLRDQFIKDLPIKIVRVNFNWTFPDSIHPFEKLIDSFTARERNKKEAMEEVKILAEVVKKYWEGRPSVVSYLILGGSLGATITRETL
ncbi:MAG: hypothetical protein AAB693_00175, partial [Patescibacteria group bacterium]